MGLKKLMYIINGVERMVICDPEKERLSTMLRRIGLTGVKVGCGTGQCGACTVLLNGEPVRSCVKKVSSVSEYSRIETIEGLGTASRLHPLQLAWIVYGGVQCGFCTPGFIMSAKGLLDKNLNPTRQEVRDWFTSNKNICRCTGYKPLIDAVMAAAKVMRGEMTMQELDYKQPDDGRVYGTAYPRPYALARVLGVAEYGDDLASKMPEETLELAVVMPDVPHGIIKSINFSEAENMTGVVKVITAKDIRGDNNIGKTNFHARSKAGFPVRPVLCDKKVYRKGDIIALVAADTREHARAAAKFVKVEIEPLPVMSNYLEAVLPGAVRIHEESDNEWLHVPVFKGEDTREIIENSDYVVEGSFYSSREPHLALEPHAMQAYVDDEGVLTIHWKSQSLHSSIAPLSKALNYPQDKIRIIDNAGGGSFGLAMSTDAPALVAAATLAVGHPVTLTMSYAEHQLFTGKRSPAYSNARFACNKDGKITAIEFDVGIEHGAYPETGGSLEIRTIRFPGYGLNIPNIRGLVRGAYSNNSYGVAYRAYGSPQAYTFSEQLIDMLAEKAGIDPYVFRYINAARPGDTTNNSMPYHVYPVVELMDKLRPYYLESLEWAKQPVSSASKKRGVGVALGGFHAGNDTDKCEVWLELNSDGTITDYNCWQELGQGADMGSVAFTCKALKPLGIRPDQVRLVKDDTGKAPFHGGSSGSRSHIASGQAHIVAANMLLDAMRKTDGTYRTYDEMVAEGIPTLYKGVWTSVGEHKALDPNTGVGDPMQSHNHNICVARVEVDIQTGKVEVIATRSAVDVGVIGNKLTNLGQAYGGMEHSIGFALQEDYSDLDKKYYTMIGCGTLQCNQMPDDCEFEFIETHRKNGPFGSSGASEGYQSSPHAAILNAIYNAVGVRIYEIPATPRKILEGIKARAEGREIKPSPYYLGPDFDEVMDEIKENPIGSKTKADDH